MKEKNKKNQKGITLIALVITIIVLLILAGVSIAMLTGENGILGQATNAREKTVEAKEKEVLALAITTIKTKITEKLNETNLEEEIVKLEGKDNVTISKEEEEKFYKVIFDNTKNGYLVTEKGSILDSKIKLDVDYEEDSGIIYITPNYPNLEDLEELFESEEDYLRTILSLNTFEENEEIFVHRNSVIDMVDEVIDEPYKNSNEVCMSLYEFASIEEVAEEEGIEKEEWLLNNLIEEWFGFYGVENPDGSFDYGAVGSSTQFGYEVEGPGEYKFKVTFLGTTVEKVITVE